MAGYGRSSVVLGRVGGQPNEWGTVGRTRTDGRTDEDGRTDGRTRTDGRSDEDGRTDGRTDGRSDEDGRTDGRTDITVLIVFGIIYFPCNIYIYIYALGFGRIRQLGGFRSFQSWISILENMSTLFFLSWA